MADIIKNPTPDPGDVLRILQYLAFKIKKAKEKLGQKKAINKKSSAEDIDELNRIFSEFRTSAEEQAKQMESMLCAEVTRFAEDLRFAARTDAPVFQKYQVHFQRFDRKLDTLPGQIEGVMMDKVSRVISLDSPECRKMIQMLPGSEKDKAAGCLLRSALRQGQEAVISRAETLCRELVEEYEYAVSDAIDRLSISAAAMAKEAERLENGIDSEKMQISQAENESVRQALCLLDAILLEEVA